MAISLNIRYANRARAKLAAPITAESSSITVETGKGALFMAAIDDVDAQWLECFIVEGDNFEFVGIWQGLWLGTLYENDTFFLDRAYESTTAKAFSTNAEIFCAIPGGWVQDVNQRLLLHDTQINNKSNLESPTFTGTPSAPTAADGTNTTQIATTAFVQSTAGLAYNQATVTANTSINNNAVTNYIGGLTVVSSGNVPYVLGNQWLTFYGFTEPLTRYYRLKAKVKFTPTAGGVRKAWLIKIIDGVETEIDYRVISGSADNDQTIVLESPIMRLKDSGSYNVNDKIELRVFQDSGAALNLLAGSYFELERLK